MKRMTVLIYLLLITLLRIFAIFGLLHEAEDGSVCFNGSVDKRI